MDIKDVLKKDIDTLDYMVSHALDTLSYINRIYTDEMPIKGERNKREILKRLIDHSLLECHRLFDETPGTLSFRCIGKACIDALGNSAWLTYLDRLREFQNKYGLLLRRIENHRHIRIAHMQREEELGFDPQSTAALNLFFEKPEWLTPVEPEFVHITLSNFPQKEIVSLLNDLKQFLADELLKLFLEKYHPNK